MEPRRIPTPPGKGSLPSLLRILAILTTGGFFIPAAVDIARFAAWRSLWNDEVISHWIISRDFPSMLKATYSGVDGMLPLFYVLSWPIATLFPDNEIAARWVQVVCTLVAPWVMFEVIRRRFSLFCAAITVMPLIFFIPQYGHLSWQLRGYGFLLLASALAIFTLDHPTETRNNRWIALNALTQVFLVSAHPFGIFYCALLGATRALTDRLEQKKGLDRALTLSYIPAALAVLAWTPAILASKRLMDPPWQPATTLETLTTILFPRLSDPWFMVFITLSIVPLLAFQKQNKPQTTFVGETPLFLTLVPLTFLTGTLLIWAYSLTHPLYLERYFSPNIWAWCLLAAILFHRLSQGAPPLSLKASLTGALIIGAPMLTHTLGPAGQTQTQAEVEANHLLFQGTTDNQILDPRFPVLSSDLNLFMERMHYNPHSLDYRAVFERPKIPPAPNVSSTERSLTEGMITLGMPPEKLLDPSEAALLALKTGGVTYIGIKPTKEAQKVLENLKTQGFQVQSQTITLAGVPFFVDTCTRGKRQPSHARGSLSEKESGHTVH
jgi:hypothetical protein